MTTPDLGAFAASLAELEARLAAAESSGEALPAQAHEMLVRLRALNEALAGLAQSLDAETHAPRAATGEHEEPEEERLDDRAGGRAPS